MTILLIAEILLAGTTGILEGFITDKKTGEPLIGVNVVVLGTQRGAATNDEGFFQILNLPAGRYTIKLQMMGYRIVNYENVVILSDLRTKLRISLEEGVVETEALVVKARRPLIQKDITGSTIRVSEEKMEQLPISTFADVLPLQTGVTDEGHVRGGKTSEVLYLIDGLPVQDAISGDVGIHLPRSSVTQMGIQTGGFDSEYGNALSGVVNVITKSGNNEFEAMAAGEQDYFEGFTQCSRSRRLEGFVGGPVVKDRLFYFMSAEGHFSDTRWWQDFHDSEGFPTFFDSPISKDLSGFMKMDAQINSSMRLSVQGLYSSRNWRDYEFSWRYNLEGLPVRSREVIRGALLWSHILTKNTFYTINLSYHHLNSDIGEGSKYDMELTPYQYDFFLQYILSGNRLWRTNNRQDIATVKGDITSQISDRHLIKGGFQFQYYDIYGDIVKYEPQMTYFGKPMLDKPLLNFSTAYRYYPNMGSCYLQDKFELSSDGGVISVGIRYDYLDPRAKRPMVELIPVSEDEYVGEVTEYVDASVKGAFSPRVGFSAPLSVKGFVFVNIGMYTQFPMFHYLYSGIDNVALRSGMSVLRGNPDLKPETNLIWEVSYKHTLPMETVISATYFSKQTKNQIDTKTFIPSNSRIAGDYGFAEYVNNDRGEARGFEFSLARESGQMVTGSVSYTYMIAKGISSTAEQGILFFEWGIPEYSRLHYLSWDQRHTIKLNLNLHLPWGMEASSYWQYHSARPFTYYPSKDGFTPDDPLVPFVPNNDRMEPFYMFNAKVTQSFALDFLGFKELVMYADARNIFNQKNVIWMDSSSRIGGELGDPSGYGVGRRTHVGIMLKY